MIDSREFLRLLAGQPGRAVLFEPFLPRGLVTRLIWRGGASLWDTDEHTVSTLCDVYAYLKSDVVFLDARARDAESLLSYAPTLPAGMGFVVLSDDEEALKAADRHPAVVSLAMSDPALRADFKKPLIFMAEPGEAIEKALDKARDCGFAALHPTSPDGFDEALLDVRDGPVLVGGYGAKRLDLSEPVEVHRRVENLFERSGGRWAVGSGNPGRELEYLPFISMLGAFGRLA